VQFLSYAKGSAGEVRSQLDRALDRKYISDDEFEKTHMMALEIGKMISGLMTYLQKTSIEGTKFHIL
jgi:four helix bundle protein